MFYTRYKKMQLLKHLFFIILLLRITSTTAQVGGKYTYTFLNAPTNYRTAAHNGYATAINDGDVSIGLYNPCMLGIGTKLKFSQSFINQYSGTYSGQTAFGFTIKNKVNAAAGIQYNKYGTFDYANAGGELANQKFYASDYLFTLAASTTLHDSLFKIGANIKTIYSVYEAYNSLGLCADISGAFIHPNQRFVATAMVRNMGGIINKFNNQTERLPLDMQLGMAQRIKHAPFRIVLTAYNLNQYYIIANGTYKTNDTSAIKTGFNKRYLVKQTDNVARHLNVGVEVLLSKNFHIILSYNHKQRRELAYSFKTALSGFAMGVGLNVKKINFGIAYTNYNIAAQNWSFTITTNLGSWHKI